MRTHIIVLALIMLATPVHAQTESVEAGITPDSPLWALDIAAERFTEMLAMNENTRIALQLKHADERIAEMQVANNKMKAMEQYNNVLSRIDSSNINYNTSEMIRTRMMQHAITMERVNGTDEPIKNNMLLRVTTTEGEKARQSEELMWWSEFASKHKIQSIESSILLKYNIGMDDIHEYVPQGITKITVTQRDGSVVNEYVIRHTDDDITIMEGTLVSPTQAYIIEIADVMEYEQKYGWVLENAI